MSRSMRILVVGFCVAVLVGWGVSRGWFEREGDKSAETSANEKRADGMGALSAKALPVSVVIAGTLRPPEMTTSYAGLLAPSKQSVLGFKRDGRVQDVFVEEGVVVRQGQTLAGLDEAELDATEARIKSELASSQAKLDELIAGPRPQVIAAAEARVSESESRVKLAEIQSLRQEKLVDRLATSQSDFDAARFGLQAEQNRLAAAQAELGELREGTRREQIAAQQALCDAIRAQLQEIQTQRDDSKIVAPYDGVVARRMIDEGAVISSGTPVLELLSHDFEAQVGLPPSVAAFLRPDDPVKLRLAGETRAAVIKRVEPNVRRDTRTRVVYASLLLPPSKRVEGEVQEIAWEQLKSRGWVAGEVVELIPPEREVSRKSGGNQLAGKRDAIERSSQLGFLGDSSSDGLWLPTSALVRGTRGLWMAIVIPADQLVGRSELEMRASKVSTLAERGHDEATAEDHSGRQDTVAGSNENGDPGIVCERRAVEVLKTDGAYVLVQGMIRPGDGVVSEGLHRIVPGLKVLPVVQETELNGLSDLNAEFSGRDEGASHRYRSVEEI
ncbi:HlyD family efflux transporter periplasmic adaptor subunit [Roseiconus lacunae]|uniref:HlyD family secretion protein n=1 Tax=Roseiconus lacunae TaxID=2605694 RepID=UPI00308A3859|nr:HlyD family efflux transporter periplasmic adaptor subunit [Stieleria sp. HD01]